MLLHDTHAHLDLLLQEMGYLPDKEHLDLTTGKLTHLDGFELKVSVIEKLISKHDFVIHPTVSTNNFNFTYEMLKSFPKIYFQIGSHPSLVTNNFNLKDYIDNQRDLITDIESDSEMMNQIVAIGEVGLDYYYDDSAKTKEIQKELFESQIKLAMKLHLPLVIHCRDAFKDMFEILKDYPKIHGRFLVHCFTGDVSDMQNVRDLGGKIGVSGILTFKNSKTLKECVSECSLEDILIETDLPYLAPDPHRGQTCMPEMILRTTEKIADIKDIDVETVLKKSQKNAEKFFNTIF